MLKETNWIPGNEKPAWKGLYKRQRIVQLYGIPGARSRSTKDFGWSYWNGQCWMMIMKTPELALQVRWESAHQELPWKGVEYDQATHGSLLN